MTTLRDELTAEAERIRRDREAEMTGAPSHFKELDRWIVEDAERGQAPMGSPAAVLTDKAATAAKSEDKGLISTVFSEATRMVGGGVRDGAQGAANALGEIGDWLDNHVLDMRFDSDTFGAVGGRSGTGKPLHNSRAAAGWDLMPKVEENETAVGKIGRSVTSFATNFIMAGAAILRATGALASTGVAMAKGAVADATAFDPHDKRLANLILEWSDNDPAFGKAIFEYLAADPKDTALEGRFKNAVEGLGLGVAAEGVFLAARGARASWSAGGRDPLKVLDEVEKTHPKPSEAPNPEPTPDPDDLAAALKETMPIKSEVQAPPAAPTPAPKAPTPAPVTLKDPPPTEAPAAMPAPPPTPGAARDRLLVNGYDAALTRMVADEGAPKLWVDSADGQLLFAPQRPSGALDLDTKVKAALEKAPAERTASDLVALRAYRQLQEQAFKGLEVPTSGGAQSRTAITDAERAADRAGLEATQAAIAGNRERVVGSELRRQRFAAAGIKLPRGSMFPKEPASAVEKQAIIEEAGDIVQAIQSNADEMAQKLAANAPENGAARHPRDQSGFVSPSVLANMAASGIGAAGGFVAAGPDATWEERLGAAGLGALAGVGIKVAAGKGAATVSEWNAKRAAEEAARQARIKALKDPAVEGILPANARSKAFVVPKLDSQKVADLSNALKSGDHDKIAATLADSDFNLARMTEDRHLDDVINAFSKTFAKEIDTVKGGIQSHRETLNLAKSIGATPEQLAKMTEGVDNLAARVTASRALLTISTGKVRELAKAAAEKPSAERILALHSYVETHAALQARMKGVQTNVARALSSMRIKSPSLALSSTEVDAMVAKLGGFEANRKLAERLTNIANDDAINAFARAFSDIPMWKRGADALFEGWINGILSGISTHVVNVAGNAITTGFRVVEKLGEAGVGGLRVAGSHVFRYDRPEAVTQAREALDTIRGMTEGLYAALHINKAGFGELGEAAMLYARGDHAASRRLLLESENLGGSWQALGTNVARSDPGGVGTIENLADMRSISSANFEMDAGSTLGRVVDMFGAAVRTPGRMLTAGDELFKSTLYRGEIVAAARRMAGREGLEGPALVARANALAAAPTPEMMEQAIQTARRYTFTSDLGDAGRALQNLQQKVPGVRYIMPFIRTPLNILKFAGARTPVLNVLSANVRADWMAGGARRDALIARTATGAALYLMAWQLAEDGIIVGGGEKRQEAERLGGRQPYSFRVGDTYIGFNRLDPIGMFFGLAADLHAINGQVDEGDMEEATSAALLMMQHNLVSKTYLKGLSDAMAALKNPEQYGEKFVQNFVGSWVPSWVNQFHKVGDDNIQRDVNSIMDGIKSRIPGFSKDLPPAINVMGEEVTFAEGLGPDIVSPISVRTPNPSPLALELMRMNVDMRPIGRTFPLTQTEGIELTPQQYQKLATSAGALFKQWGEAAIQQRSYKDAPDSTAMDVYEVRSTKANILERLRNQAVRKARADLMTSDKALQKSIEELSRKRTAVLSINR